jgi:hypothetical protein
LAISSNKLEGERQNQALVKITLSTGISGRNEMFMTTQAVKQRRASTIFQDLVWVAADVGGALPKSVLQPVSPVTASNSYIEWYFTLYIYTAPVK